MLFGSHDRPMVRRRILELVRALRGGVLTMNQFREGLERAMQAGLFSPAEILFPPRPAPLPAPEPRPEPEPEPAPRPNPDGEPGPPPRPTPRDQPPE